MRKNLVLLFMLFSFVYNLSAGPFIIGRGRIDDAVNITIKSEFVKGKNTNTFDNLVLKPNKFFSLAELGLRANTPTNDVVLTTTGYKWKGFNLITYDVTIEDEKSGKTYYGRLAFFDAIKKAASNPVTSFYKIQISDRLYEAVDGGVIYAYEYYNTPNGRAATWILWVSDIPLR